MMRRVCSRPPFRGRRPAADRGAAALVVLALAAVAGPGGCGPAGDTGDDAAPVRILAAASLTNVLESLAPRLEAAAGRPVSMSFAASSTLARQLMAGAAADVYLSADTAWVDELEVAGLVAERRPLQANRMVLVVPRDSTEPTAAGEDETVRRLLEPRLARIAVADPSAVPAGRHARHALERAGAWTGVEPRLVSAANVRQALAWVEAGEADAGIVYATDAAVSDRVRVIGPLPVDPARPVRGAAALTPEGAARPAARAVWIALADAEATRAFADFGFEVGTADAPAPAHVREAAAP